MNTELLIIFVALNIVNVIIQTVKSIATVKCGPLVAALVNAVAYGLYTVVTVYMMCELGLGLKALIVALCNLVGVYIVKLCEVKSRKDKLWKVEATVLGIHTKAIRAELNEANLSNKYIENIGKYTEFSIYCDTQKESAQAKAILVKYNAKYFASESKTL